MVNRTVLVGAICALVGCAVGVAARQEAVAQEEKPANIRRWQQECVNNVSWGGLIGVGELNGALGRRGAEGWELVGIERELICFKRPLD